MEILPISPFPSHVYPFTTDGGSFLATGSAPFYMAWRFFTAEHVAFMVRDSSQLLFTAVKPPSEQ